LPDIVSFNMKVDHVDRACSGVTAGIQGNAGTGDQIPTAYGIESVMIGGRGGGAMVNVTVPELELQRRFRGLRRKNVSSCADYSPKT